MIIHILVDTSQVETQVDNVVEDLDNTLWSTTNIFTFTSTRSEYFKQLSRYLNYINYRIFIILLFTKSLLLRVQHWRAVVSLLDLIATGHMSIWILRLIAVSVFTSKPKLTFLIRH